MKPNHLPRALAIALLPLVLAGCKIEDIPGLGPDPRAVANWLSLRLFIQIGCSNFGDAGAHIDARGAAMLGGL